MARRQPPDDERRLILDLADQLLPGRGELSVTIARGDVVTLRARPAAPASVEGLSPYDAAIVAALTDFPVSTGRLAARSGHPSNSYFRTRLALLVESGRVRHSRRGYRLPDS
jgi:hypothetical protein